MPLLARQVNNILLFINSNDEFDDNRAFRQLFKAVDQRDSSGDGTMNAVFVDDDDRRFIDVTTNLTQKRTAGLPLVYCGSNWKVDRNEGYNIREYTGLNICFF